MNIGRHYAGYHDYMEDRDQLPNDEVYMAKLTSIIKGYPNVGVPLEPSQLLSHLYVGNKRNAEDIHTLQKLKVNYILNCGGAGMGLRGRHLYGPESGVIEYMELQAMDEEDYDITRHFASAKAFIDRAKVRGKKVLVHCDLGINLSVAICVGYLMMSQRDTLTQAVQHLKQHRRVLLTNEGFLRQIIKFARNHEMLDSDPVALRTPRDFTQKKAYQKAFQQHYKHGIYHY